MHIRSRLPQRCVVLLLLLIVAPSSQAEFGEHELAPSPAPLVFNYLAPKEENRAEDMEEVVVIAPRPESRSKLRRRMASLLVDDPGGLELQIFPGYASEELLALKQQQARADFAAQRFEPTGGLKLFRLTLERR